MNEVIMAAIQDYSNRYALELWHRFTSDESSSDDEQEHFQKLRQLFVPSPDMEFPQNPHDLLPEESFHSLPMSFFAPGSSADIFINCHNSMLNNFPHAHDFFEMIYVSKGDIVDWVDGTSIPLKQGELCIHNPNAKNMLVKMDDASDFVINIVLPPRIFQRSFYTTMRQNRQLDDFFHHFALSGDSTSNYMSFHNTSNRVDTIMELLVEEFLRGTNASRFILESTLVVLFGELIRNYQPDPFLEKLIGLIRENLTDITMKTASDVFGYHRNYFPNIVKKHTGRTFWELVTEIRLQEATTLLLFSDMALTDISEAIGYKSTASFYQHFREKYGMTPAAYRKTSV